MIQQPSIPTNIQQFLKRYHLTEQQTSFDPKIDTHVRVQCNHCAHKFNLQTKQVTAMVNTKISTNKHTFTFCPSCRHTSKFLIHHIALRQQLLGRSGITVSSDIHPTICHNDLVSITYKRGKVLNVVSMTAFELAYGSINELKQKAASGDGTLANLKTGYFSPPAIESNAPTICTFTYDEAKSTTITAQEAKSYIVCRNVGEVIDVEGWEDVVLLRLADGKLVIFTIGRFTDHDITALMEDINLMRVGIFDESLIFDVKDVILTLNGHNGLYDVPATKSSTKRTTDQNNNKKPVIVLNKRRRTYDPNAIADNE